MYGLSSKDDKDDVSPDESVGPSDTTLLRVSV